MNESIIIIVPILNEEHYIKSFLKSVNSFVIPKNTLIKVFLLDGGSTDNTKNIISSFIKDNSNFFLLDNPGKYQSQAINKVLKLNSADYIMRLDAHTIYSNNYLLNCYSVSKTTNADNVGGIWKTMQSNESYQASLVQAMTTHPFGVGNSYFRISKKISKEVDTVPFGFFKGNLFKKIGLFDERLIRCQDYEFNKRIKKFGGKIWLDSSIVSKYYNQPNLIKFYSKQFFKDAPYNFYMWFISPYTFELRHAVTLLFVLGLILGYLISFYSFYLKVLYHIILFFYLALAFLSSIQQSIRFKDIRHIIVLPFCFFLYHFLHGLGVLIGFINLSLNLAPFQKNKTSKGF